MTGTDGASGAPLDSPLIQARALRLLLSDVVVLDASIERTSDGQGRGVFGPGSDAFVRRRIPGARLADLFAEFSDPDGPFPFALPSVERLRRAAAEAGVRDDVPVVVYDRNGGAWAARVWWLLRVHGHPDVRVLDGGLAAWEEAGGELETGPARAPVGDAGGGSLTLRDPGAVAAGVSEVADIARGAATGRLVCGVRQREFEGLDGRDRAGHIPGSVSLPYPELLRADGTLDLDAVRERASALGLDRRPSIVYCGGGINAAGLVLALTAVGLPAPRLYDGSLNEWRADPSLPLETGPARIGA